MLVATVKPREFASTQFNLDEAAADIVRSYAYRLIPEEDLAEGGRDKEPHVTVRYGLQKEQPRKASRLVAGFGKVRYRFGPIGVFDQNPEFDVVYLQIQSPDLHRLNARLAELPHTDTHPKYVPHLCLAYVKKGAGKKYVGRRDFSLNDGKTREFDTLIWSGKDRHCYAIPLTGKPEAKMFKSHVQPYTRRGPAGQTEQVGEYDTSRTRKPREVKTNPRHMLVFRGMSSAEYHDWHQKGHVPKGKDTASGQMAAWAQEHSQFGGNDVMVSMTVPPGHARKGGGGPGHWIVHKPIPVDEANVQVEEGKLKSREDVDRERQEKEGARLQCIEHLKPGAIIEGRGMDVEILAKRGRSYKVKVHHRVFYTRELDQAEKEMKQAQNQVKEMMDHQQAAKDYPDHLHTFGFDGPVPTTKEVVAAVHRAIDRQQAYAAELAKEKERRSNDVQQWPERLFPQMFQRDTGVRTGPGEEDYVRLPFDKWWEQTRRVHKAITVIRKAADPETPLFPKIHQHAVNTSTGEYGGVHTPRMPVKPGHTYVFAHSPAHAVDAVARGLHMTKPKAEVPAWAAHHNTSTEYHFSENAGLRDHPLTRNNEHSIVQDIHQQSALHHIAKNTTPKDKPQMRHGMTSPERMVHFEHDGIKHHYSTFKASGSQRSKIAATNSLTSQADADIPPELHRHTKDIYHTGQSNEYDHHWAKTYNTPGFKAAGTGGSGDGSIVLYNHEPGHPHLLAHEMAHNMARARYGNTHPPDHSDFAQATKGEPHPSDYAKHNAAEDFAESVSHYVTEKGKFKKNHPKRHAVIDRMMKDPDYHG